MDNWGAEAQRRLNEIATLSEPGPGVTRFPFTPEHAAAREMISEWMTSAGLSVHLDAACTLIGRLDGPKNAPCFLIGSHQDSVRFGGAYDGIMGIALGCLAIEKLRSEGIELPFAIEVLAFADEEGARFPTALLGPRAMAGTYDSAVLDMVDNKGVRLADALDAAGGKSADLSILERAAESILGYLEAHIEQGPVLETNGHSVGIVTGICGIERNAIKIRGRTGHAGTAPMELRQDALVTAAALIIKVDSLAKTSAGIRATVGYLELSPNIVNAIPQTVDLTLEIRSENDADRHVFSEQIKIFCKELATAHQTPASMQKTYEQIAVKCDPQLVDTLYQATKDLQITTTKLASGATHDASAMADLCPMAMLFVRCKNGLSHAPEEYASAKDMEIAIKSITGFLNRLAAILAAGEEQ